MHINKLQIHGVRNLNDVTVSPNHKVNIFTGKNASGKTSFLEAIHILTRSKSFRTPRIRDVINNEKKKLVVSAEIVHEKLGTLKTGVEKGEGFISILQNGDRVKTVSEQAKSLPVIVITQDLQQVVTGGPKQRRHWLDWAMFHVEPDYLGLWKQYFRALRQRNILLKKGETNEELYRAWEAAMVKSTTVITRQRKAFLQAVTEYFEVTFTGRSNRQIRFNFQPGWPESRPYSQYLKDDRREDQRRGFTRYGAHQAEIAFMSNHGKVKQYFSRGEIKLFLHQLLMTQAKVIQQKSRINPVVLIDDYAAELDKANSEHLLDWLKDQQYQVFITTTEALNGDKEATVFHVEHGAILN